MIIYILEKVSSHLYQILLLYFSPSEPLTLTVCLNHNSILMDLEPRCLVPGSIYSTYCPLMKSLKWNGLQSIAQQCLRREISYFLINILGSLLGLKYFMQFHRCFRNLNKTKFFLISLKSGGIIKFDLF